MKRFFYPSFGLAQCARRMCSLRNGEQTLKYELGAKRKAIRLDKLLQADLIINKTLAKNESIECDQWATVREELLKQFTEITEVNVDSQVYDICSYYSRLDQSIDYFKFLERNKYPLNLATMTMYMRLMGMTTRPLTADEEKSVIQVYNKIRKDHKLLDPQSANYCTYGLSKTKEWLKCFELMDMVKTYQNTTSTILSSVISAAFRNNRPDLAWKLLDESLVSVTLQPDVYLEYLKYCKRNFTEDKVVAEVEKMLFMWQKYNVLPFRSVIDGYEEFFKSMGYVEYHTTITKAGICCHCKNQLKKTHITQGDFKVLATALLNKLIIGKDVYRNTSPEELKRYLIFLKTMRPYDVVIDGLNVAYATSKRFNNDTRGLVENVLQVVHYFRRREKRTLVVGRIHMKWWKSRDMKALEDVTDVFYTKNLTQDDQFLLHLTLTSGANTFFVSRDLMRQHLYKIENPTLKQIFKSWQMSRQYFFTKDAVTNKIKLMPPLEFEPNAQKNDEGWHVPYTENSTKLLPISYSAPADWLCLKHGNRKNRS